MLFYVNFNSGPHSTPFFNDSCSDTETTTGEDAILQSAVENPHFMHIKEEIENDSPYYKSNINNNIPLNSFNGKFNYPTLKDLSLILFSVLGLDLNKRRDGRYVGLSFSGGMDPVPQSLFLNPPMAHQNPPQSASGLNPIDRLYSMQNSYFCGEEQMMEP